MLGHEPNVAAAEDCPAYAVAVPRGEASSSGALTITLVAMTLSASMILVDQTAVPLATPHVVEDLGGQIDHGP